MRLAIGTGMVDAALVAKDFYNAVNLNPEYVADFFESYYRVNKVPSTFSGALNFARTGTATYTDATGTLQTAATGVARTDHHIWNGSAWVNEMRLESDAATNLLTYSEQFDNAAWVKMGTFSLTSNTAIGPDGATTADTLEDIAASFGNILQSFSYVPTVTFSVYIKKDAIPRTTRFPMVRVEFTGGTANNADVALDTSTGEVSNPTSTATLNSFEAVDDGDYWRLIISATDTGSNTAGKILIFPAVGASSTWAFATGVTGSIIAWGAQLETGSIATSYIKTEATTATRNAETLTASFGDLPYNLTAVSIQMEGTVSGTPSTLIDWQADASNLITLSAGASDFTFTQEQAGTVDSVTGGSYTSGINVPFNIASRHGSTFINGAVDGVALTANTTPTALPDLTTTDLDIAPNFNGTIKLLRIWGSDIGDTGIAAASD